MNGQARFIGTAPNGLAVLELIGPRDDLVKVYMLAGVPSDNEAAATESAIYLAGVLSLAVPGWEAGTEWLTDSISALPEERLITTEHGAAVISLEWFEELGFIGLEIRARGWE